MFKVLPVRRLSGRRRFCPFKRAPFPVLAAATVASVLLGSGQAASPHTFQVSSIADLQAKIDAAKPGDQIIVANGVYTTTGPIKVAREGTAARPIVIAAETVGVGGHLHGGRHANQRDTV